MLATATTQGISIVEAAEELLRRRMARKYLLDFTQYTFPAYEVNWHHRLLCEYLDRFVAGEIKRLMVFMPPRHGKSQLVSRHLPAYVLGRNPNAHVLGCSYSADLASAMNRDVQRIIDSEAYARLFPDTVLSGSNIRTSAHGSYLRNSDEFEIVGHRGSYKSAGVGGPITGKGATLAIIDDPVKNRAEADSEVFREHLWEWYTSTFFSRQDNANVGILITLTRWHENGLEGRLLDLAENSEIANKWDVLSLPAIAEDMAEYDPRKEGEALWPSRFPADFMAVVKEQSSRDFSALYQQRPAPKEGSMFKRHWFPIVDIAPAEAQCVRYWDNAGTEGDGDYTAGVLMSRTKEGVYYVEDVVRGQWSAGQREDNKKQTAALDGSRVRIWNEQEPGSAGKESAGNTIRNLEGYVVHADRPTGDKEIRAEGFASQCEAGNVRVVRGDWNKAYIDEMCSFPMGKYDDQVDGSSGAFNKLVVPVTPRKYTTKVYK